MSNKYQIVHENEPSPYLLEKALVDLVIARIKKSDSPLQLYESIMETLLQEDEQCGKANCKIV